MNGAMNTDSPELVKRAIDMGIKYLDTANVYFGGNSERLIGRIVEESGKRDQLYIATKMRFARDTGKNTAHRLRRHAAALRRWAGRQAEQPLRFWRHLPYV